MQASGEIVFGETLFSVPEHNYIDYILNRKKYSNGWDLRNKYVHGSYPLEHAVQERDYFQLMEIMVMIVIKINEEFCVIDRYQREDA